MRDVITRRADLWDVLKISHRLRAEDERELQAAHPTRCVRGVLKEAWEKSQGACWLLYTTADEQNPILLFGCVTVRGEFTRVGVPWMVATPEVGRHAISVIREARQWFRAWSWWNNHHILMNHVEVRNTLHVRWLDLIGVSWGDPVKRNGIEVVPFYY